MNLTPYIHLYQYDLLTAEFEIEISGTIVADRHVVTFTPINFLSYNKEYQFVILPGIEGLTTGPLLTKYESVFTTQMIPMYSSIVLVRLTAGSLLDNVRADTINRSILIWSLYAKALSPEAINNASVPWYITRWVTCKVAYELLAGLLESYISAANRKRLGDFEVAAAQDPSIFIKPKLGELVSCLDTTTLYIINVGQKYGKPAWAARAKEHLEAANHLFRVPIPTGRQFDIEDISDEDYSIDGKRKKLWF